jgi:hypothetical protein
MNIRASVVLMALLGGCAMHSGTHAELAPASRAEWPALMAQASQEASAGRFGVADRILSDFSVHYPATPEAAESMYWRAIYKLDPSNPNASAREASVLLDSYLTSGVAAHRTEASTLRRLAGVIENRSSGMAPGAGPTRTIVEQASTTADKGKDDEIARLKEELAKANAELERLKKRLAQPTMP